MYRRRQFFGWLAGLATPKVEASQHPVAKVPFMHCGVCGDLMEIIKGDQWPKNVNVRCHRCKVETEVNL